MFNFFSSSSSELDKGIALMRNQEYGQARDYFRDLVEKNINVPEAYFNLGKCYF
jgi:Flp pilus assembly protein TadD